MDDPWLSARTHQAAALAEGEAELYPAVHRAVEEYLSAVRAGLLGAQTAVTAAASDPAQPPDWAAYPDDTVWTRLVDRYITPAWRRVWLGSYQLTAPQASEGAGEGRAEDEAEALAARLRGLPRRVWDRLRRAAQDAQDRRETPEHLRDRLAQLTAPGAWQGQTATVTRTEAHLAVEAGAMGAALDEQARTRTPWAKVWAATPDDRTRAEHRAAHGQERPLAEPFDIGGARLQFPGDPLGPPDTTVNCRCIALHRPQNSVNL